MIVNIIYSDSSGGVKAVSESLSDAYSNHGIPHTLFNLKSIQGNLLIRFNESIKAFSKKKHQVFILQHFDAIFLGLFLRFFGFNNFINVVHTDLVEYYQSINFIKKILIYFLIFSIKNNTVVFVSKESELRAKKRFKLKKTTTIYNTNAFPNIKNESDKDNRVIKLGSISRLHKVKNIDLLVLVLKEVRHQMPNVELLIYGAGNELERLEHYINEQDCTEFVKLLGASNDKEAMYKSIDALVSFSSIEGFGMTILESISYGKPVFYTDCSSGPREIMSPLSDPLVKTKFYEKTAVGYLVKPIKRVAGYSNRLSDYEIDYVDVLKSFTKDVESNSFNMAFDSSKFSERIIVNQWLNLFNKIMSFN